MTETEKPWNWPKQWVKDEAWWRDVGSRTLSGLLVLLIAYIFAVMLGLVTRPGVWQMLLAVAGGTVLISVVTAALGLFIDTRADNRAKQGGLPKRPFVATTAGRYSLLLLALALTVVVGFMASEQGGF